MCSLQLLSISRCNCEVFLVAIVNYFCRQHSAKNTTVNSQCAEMLRGKTRLGKHPDKENYITAMIGANTNTKSNQMKSRRMFAIVSITGLY